MYDTVHLWLESGKDSNKLEEKLSCLSNQKEIIDCDTGTVVLKGRLRNLRVKAGYQGVLIQGSLPKYFLGNNAEVLNRRGTQEAIEQLSDTLKLPMQNARVCRLDVANNLFMRLPVEDYISQFGNAPLLQKSDFRDHHSVQFSNTLRTISAYNKHSQLKHAHESIPDLFKGRNVLRFECQFKKRVSKQFCTGTVTGADLSEEIFYMKSLDKWKAGYYLIQKVRKGAALSMKSTKDYLQSLAFYGLLKIGGYDVVLSILDSAKKQGKLGKQHYYRLKKMTHKISKREINDTEDIISELDRKIEQAVVNYR